MNTENSTKAGERTHETNYSSGSRSPWRCAGGMLNGYAIVNIENQVVVDGPIHSNADARLISAAPELLEFVKRVDEIIRQGRPSNHLWNYCVENRESIITKAEGK